MSVFERIDQKIRNMNTMLKRLGIDSDTFAQKRIDNWFTASMHACQACPNGEICRAWLASASERIDRLPEFCPNALRFEQGKALMGAGNALN